MDDEEATSISIDENEERVPLSQFELAKATKKRFDVLSENLVGEEEEVECPECGKECSGRESLKQHIARSDDHEPQEDSSYGYFVSERQIAKNIAESSSFDYKTVENLVSVASIPSQFTPFLKIPEERDNSERKVVEETIGKDFTFANQKREILFRELAIWKIKVIWVYKQKILLLERFTHISESVLNHRPNFSISSHSSLSFDLGYLRSLILCLYLLSSSLPSLSTHRAFFSEEDAIHSPNPERSERVQYSRDT